MAKIEKLTEQQAAMLPTIRDEYLAHGLSTAPADRTRAESAFARVYERIKLPTPRVIWVSSPLGAHFAHALLSKFFHLAEGKVGAQVRAQVRDQVGAQVRAQVRDQVGDQVWAQVRDQVWAQVWAQVRDQVGAQVRAQVRDQVGDQVWAQVRDQVWAQVWAQVGDQVGDQVRDQVWAQVGDQVSFQYPTMHGQHDATWAAWVMAAVAIGVRLRSDTADGFKIFLDLCQSCMWAYAYTNTVIACDRPLSISRDERGRLHNDDGPAMEFRDGWTIHAVHGVRVPSWLFTNPERLTLDAIHAESNTEIQRVMIERFGWDRYAEECGADIIDHDERWGTLMRRKTRDGEPILFLRVVNRSPEPDGSFRKYVLPLDSRLRPIPDPAKVDDDFGEPQKLTALNGVASTFGLRGNEYAEMLSAES